MRLKLLKLQMILETKKTHHVYVPTVKVNPEVDSTVLKYYV